MASQSLATRSKNSFASLASMIHSLPSVLGVTFLLAGRLPLRLTEDARDHGPRRERERPHGAYCPREPEEVGDHARREGAHRVAHVSPEAVDAQGARPPGWVRGVRDGGDEGGVDHGGPESEQGAPHDPPSEAPPKHGDEQRARLHPHAADDEAL